MLHAMRFEGGYERNHASLTANATDFEGEDGKRHPLGAWPARANGIHYSIQEQQGKRFFVVRLGYADKTIVLDHPVRVDPDRHMGGRRFSAEPIALEDGPAGMLLGDIIDANHDQAEDLMSLRDTVRDAMKAARPIR